MSTFSELIDFTRSSTGTYLDSVVYGDELVTNGTFDTDTSSWTIAGSSPLFTWNANGYIELDRNGGSSCKLQQTLSTQSEKTYKCSFSLLAVAPKVGVLIDGAVQFEATTTGDYVFYFSSGTSSSTALEFTLLNSSTATASIDNVSVVEVTSTAGGTPLLRTADTNEPRLEYDASGQPLGLLIEEQRTNNLPQSNNASVLDLNASGITTAVNSSEVQAPSNTETVIKLNKTGGGYGYARTSYTTVSSAQTLSVFVKKGTARYVGLRQLNTAGSSNHTTFDLDTKTWTYTGYSDSRGYQDYGNGWLRIWVTEDGSSKSWASVAIVNENGTENNSETGTLYVYGFQREAGAFPTSYIPTSGSTVTRNKDLQSVPSERFGVSSSSTIAILAKTANISGASYLCELGKSNNDRIFMKAHNAEHLVVILSGSTTATLDAGTFTSGDYGKAATAIKDSDYAAVINGGAVATQSSGSLPSSFDKIYLGTNGINNGEHLNGHIKRIQYFPKRLSNDELVELTKPSSSPTMSLTFDGQATSELVEGLHD